MFIDVSLILSASHLSPTWSSFNDELYLLQVKIYLKFWGEMIDKQIKNKQVALEVGIIQGI